MNLDTFAMPASTNNMGSPSPAFLKFGPRFYLLILALLSLTFFTANFYKFQSWGIGPFLLVIVIMMVAMFLAGVNVYSAVFLVGALLPNLNSFLPLGPFSVTWIEISMVFSILFFIRKPLYLNKIGLLSIGLYMSCIFSLIGSPLGFLSAGLLFRFGILLAFVNLLILQNKDPLLLKSFFCGLLIIPFTACSTYAGEGSLMGMFSANILAFSRAVYSFQYPIWFSLIIPLLIYIKAPKVIKFVFAVFISMIFVLSFARSIIIGTTITAFFYIFFYKDNNQLKRVASKFLIIVLIGIGIFIVTLVLKFFEFTNLDNDSNMARFEKMPIAFNKFKEHPFFGAGFGASNDNTFAEKWSISTAFQEQISSEFGPLTVLSEIGMVGAFFLFFLIFLSVRESARVIKNKNILSEYKLVILISFGGFVSSFLNSNSIAAIIVYLFLFIPMFFYKNKNDQSIL